MLFEHMWYVVRIDQSSKCAIVCVIYTLLFAIVCLSVHCPINSLTAHGSAIML